MLASESDSFRLLRWHLLWRRVSIAADAYRAALTVGARPPPPGWRRRWPPRLPHLNISALRVSLLLLLILFAILIGALLHRASLALQKAVAAN